MIVRLIFQNVYTLWKYKPIAVINFQMNENLKTDSDFFNSVRARGGAQNCFN